MTAAKPRMIICEEDNLRSSFPISTPPTFVFLIVLLHFNHKMGISVPVMALNSH
jgi:hypothetical protein